MRLKSSAVLKSLSGALSRKAGATSFVRFVALTLAAAFITATSVQTAQAEPKYAGIVIDAKTGKVLYGEDPDGLRYPASLTKMMTLYLTFEALNTGRISLDSKVPVSANAAKEPPSKLGVRAGGSITVEQAILALVTRSANDMATALGEYLGGSEDRFARMMTAKARALGMTRTTYRNANGLPNTAQMTTARDQARLGVALRQHFPQYYGYFNTRTFNFGKQVIGNHNRLVGTVKGVDGIKTGYTRAAGSNLATSAQLDGRSIVAVVLGGRSSAARDATMRKLVATYLPQASRGGNSNLIAQTRSAPVEEPVAVAAAVPSVAVAATAAGLPNSGPVPQTRYEEAPVSAFAGSSSNAAVKAMEAATWQKGKDPIVRAPVAPDRNLITNSTKVDNIVTASTAGSASAAPSVSPRAEAPQGGWVIQIGASPDENSARGLLQNAQEKGGAALRSAKPFTVAFSKDGSQIYRARFGGFDGQNAAVNACNALKKKGVSCWASLQ
ncbi:MULTISPECIES: D-alanyl-D-alanine carboxypeptidase [unclassified Agrobacterium]|jgi:D-alanyl-D-alanine carboxypeptidase|uniref:D-alanyl-D-alanine carboxypeptidase n=1 Tax=unclassified Agrobacterium TaxID=2632611 RepID=UPI002446EFDC|nr:MULTISPECIES: D-alanyl-D-alanine carboxypeptidase [unclassified Agrobacterium]MDH0614099.1 D-alanyl-D-alanine carboxypeptidase [Agrobacterium sp. GD03872]MDH0695606.1 D-alanyl-D-alanine carboxypeptidase [Agrobacterium sp. GD03871]MDH1058508.1 D-alanyl-D-alanine carboxypeptidase [Agrobacterium sp. GD03992]MDH2209550.1 D-alanyl-D-alanine carboxypeptidase [Agrobacterium sp. GD03643]MDH2218954.1 D-alanyl-D-alanine carboxypeptidase [Agrobacterium sp. GD03638]